MKPIIFTLALSVLNVASAHYVFNKFIVNGTIKTDWRYIRQVSPFVNDTKPRGPKQQPQFDLTSPNTRCGRDAMTTGNETEIATVTAGHEIGFRIDFWNAPAPMFHVGPRMAYLSRSPTQTPEGLQSWDGDGDWFKIAQLGAFNATHWFEFDNVRLSEYNFTIPATTPPGLYLLRVESIYPRIEFNRTQFYMNCAQIQIVGKGNPASAPGPMTRFPGAYDDTDDGIWIEYDKFWHHADEYKYPGPTVWSG